MRTVSSAVPPLSVRLVVGLSVGLAACGPGPVPPFEETAAHPEAAFLSVTGTASGDLWVVGAQPSPNAEPVVLHREDGAWTPIATGQVHDLWWAHTFEDGPTFLAGGGATVLKVEGDAVERTPTPVFFGNTVYGVWGATPDDMWAVGGFAGRDGFAWRYDGAAWTPVDLPDDLPRTGAGEIPALFKVWGRGADDVWLVGGLGTVLHWDGQRLDRVEVATDEQLFTVTGDDAEVVIVGGSDQGVVLRGGLDGFVDDTPEGAPLLQGVTLHPDGTTWVAGAGGFAARRHPRKGWEPVDLGFVEAPQSVHALYAAPDGSVWGAGGGVLSPNLDAGVMCGPEDVPRWMPELDTTVVDETCPEGRVDIAPDQSIARRWNELLLDSIRRDIPHPPKHARNLYHVGIAMFDAWAAYQDTAVGVLHTDRETADDLDAARDTALSYATYRVLTHRYATAVGAAISLDCYDSFMDVLGLDPTDTHTEGDDPIAVGNRIGEAIIAHFADDGANEANGYADTTDWAPSNPVMIVDRPGTNVVDPDVWQQLNLGTAETQNGIVLEDSVQPYIGPQWRHVEPFAITKDPVTGLYSDPVDGYPTVNDPQMLDDVVQVIRRSAHLDVDDGVMIDIGPAGRGDNSLGADDGDGYDLNPVTGQPYAPNLVPRGDFARVVAEIWADGPSSETPPGHWVDLGNEVSDRLAADDLVPFGQGDAVDRLAWDVGLYLTVSAAVHDAAISAWELKRDSLGPRPITLIRWMGQNGQRTDASLPSFHEDGLPLEDGLIELITEESAAEGGRHHHLRWHVGEIAIWGWPGEPGDRANDHTPLRWMRAKDWIPYQRRTFVTPAFPGFTSGHSTFSRAAAEALTAYTGSPYFPGGLHEHVLEAYDYLVFEAGPTQQVRLQWATYADAADQAGQSRLYGGIHIFADDRVGRINGEKVGLAVADLAREHVFGTP